MVSYLEWLSWLQSKKLLNLELITNSKMNLWNKKKCNSFYLMLTRKEVWWRTHIKFKKRKGLNRPLYFQAEKRFSWIQIILRRWKNKLLNWLKSKKNKKWKIRNNKEEMPKWIQWHLTIILTIWKCPL